MTPMSSRALSRDPIMQDTEVSKTVLWVDGALGALESQITKNTWIVSEEDVRVVVVKWFQRQPRYFWLLCVGNPSTTLSVGWLPLFLIAFTPFPTIIPEWGDLKTFVYFLDTRKIHFATDVAAFKSSLIAWPSNVCHSKWVPPYPVKVKVKAKFHPRTGHEGPKQE
jgi:hypothetical protein